MRTQTKARTLEHHTNLPKEGCYSLAKDQNQIKKMKKIFFLLPAAQALTAQTRWYVNQEAESDSNNSQSPSAPFRLVNKAVKVADDYTGLTRDNQPDLGALEYFAPDAIMDALAQKIECYPNPFSDVIHYTNPSFAKADTHIISISGQNFDGMVYWASAKYNAIDTHLLPKGIYILTLQNQASLQVKD